MLFTNSAGIVPHRCQSGYGTIAITMSKQGQSGDFSRNTHPSGPKRSAPRLHISARLAVGAQITLPERAARHVAVLRLREGDEVTLFNGDGGEFRAVLERLGRASTAVRVTEWLEIERESPLFITLAQCVSSGDRMDLTIQKATELGVQSIVPIISKRSIVRLSGDRADRKLEHWRNIVISACEQCGRNRPPVIMPLAVLEDWLANLASPGKRLLLAPDAPGGPKLLQWESTRESAVTFLVGPEGGLAPDERTAAEAAGFLAMRLGPRILRTETAPLAAIAALQTLWGDLG